MNLKGLIAILLTASLATACSSSKNDSSTPPSDAPSIFSVSPAFGPTGGGTAITITGANFQTGATVTFDGASATDVTVVSANQITASTPTNTTARFVDVRVVNPDAKDATRTGAYLYCFAHPATHPEIVNGCPPAGVQTVNKDDAAVRQYLVSGQLPPLN